MKFLKKYIFLLLLIFYQPIKSEITLFDSGLFKTLTSHVYLKATFNQQTLSQGILRQVDGKIFASREGKFRIEYLEPLNEVFISKGNQLIKYDPLLEQLEIFPASYLLSQAIVNLISLDLYSLEKHFLIISCNETTTKSSCKIIPRNKESFIKSAEIYLQKNLLNKIIFIDNFEQQVIISFKDLSHNFLEDAIFEFEAPIGTDVIYHSKDLQ
jgi:outer membrane lipoprotein carrier protein|tara:strand:+ start:417 stop:1052 length:636 start_codon:yes stop_codon:yes gene_type:complete